MRLPLYAQVEEALAQRIADGAFTIGSRLPSEEELMEEFGVSRTTIRSTIQNLVRRGLVEIRRGIGTYVSSTQMVQELTALTGFVEDMRILGRTAGARVIGREVIAADHRVAGKLAIAVGTCVVRILRVRLSDGVPLSYDETFLPEDLGRKVMADDLATYPIFSLLEERYDTPLIEAQYELEAVGADPDVAHALEVATGSPVLRIDRTSYSSGHRPVDYERLHYRGDLIRFRTVLGRKRRDEL